MSQRELRSRKPYDRLRSETHAGDSGRLHDKAPPTEPGASRTAGVRKSITPNNRLIISDLHYNVTAKDLTVIFSQIGTLVREPVIKYDRSGRSTGIAFVHYEQLSDAIRAKKQFHGVLAKGQPMTIDFEAIPPGRRSAANGSLVHRISRPLIERLALDAFSKDASLQPTKDAARVRGASGPTRTRPKRGGIRPRRSKEEAKTAEDLDKELDAFMSTDVVGNEDTDVVMAT